MDKGVKFKINQVNASLCTVDCSADTVYITNRGGSHVQFIDDRGDAVLIYESDVTTVEDK